MLNEKPDTGGESESSGRHDWAVPIWRLGVFHFDRRKIIALFAVCAMPTILMYAAPALFAEAGLMVRLGSALRSLLAGVFVCVIIWFAIRVTVRDIKIKKGVLSEEEAPPDKENRLFHAMWYMVAGSILMLLLSIPWP